ncbi:MAG: R3H domain-containing nucleic acid-binding protein, partial [Acidobacteriota bacterium]
LRGRPSDPEVRVRTPEGKVEIIRSEPSPEKAENLYSPPLHESSPAARRGKRKSYRVFPFGVSRLRLERAIQKFRVPAHVVSDLGRANIVLTLKSQEKRQSKRLLEARAHGVPFYVIRSNTPTQIDNFLRSLFDLDEEPSGEQEALREAESAISVVREQGHPVELSPQSSHLRRLQHILAEQNGFSTESKGRDPNRRVVIYP